MILLLFYFKMEGCFYDIALVINKLLKFFLVFASDSSFGPKKSILRELRIQNVKNVIEIKKRYYDLFNLNNRSQIENAVSFENIENGCLKIKYSKNKEVKLVIYINPTILHTTHLGLDGCNRVLYDDCKVDFDLKKSVSSAKIHPLSALILVK